MVAKLCRPPRPKRRFLPGRAKSFTAALWMPSRKPWACKPRARARNRRVAKLKCFNQRRTLGRIRFRIRFRIGFRIGFRLAREFSRQFFFSRLFFFQFLRSEED